MASSLLGTGFFQPQARPGGVTIAQEKLAEEIAPFMKDYLEKEAALATLRSEGLRDEETGELVLDPVTGEPVDPGGYKAFTGQTIADFTPEQLAAQRGLAGLAGFDIITDPETGERSVTQTGTGLSGTRFADAEALIRGQQEEFTGDVAQRFMSPFQQAVIDIEKREAQQKFEQDVLPKVQAAAIQAGSFGGSRGAILEAEALRNQQQLLGDIQAKGLQSAFTQGQKAFEQQKARERGQAQALIGLSPAESSQRIREIQGLERVGAAQQAQTQTALDEAYKEFLEEQAFPETVLDRMQSAAFGFPALRQTVTQRPTTFGPSPFQTLATNVGAIGTGVGNLFGQLGGRKAKHGGVVSRRDGGLVPLVRRRLSGQTSAPTSVNRPKSLSSFYLDQPRIRQEMKEEAEKIAATKQRQIQDRVKREQKRRDPFGVGLDTTALFRMLGQASNVKDYRGPQLAGIGREADKIAVERMTKNEQLAQEAEAAELLARERALETKRKNVEQDLTTLYRLDTLAEEKRKNASSLSAAKFKRSLDASKLSSQVIKELGQTAINRAGIAARYDDDGQLQTIGKQTLSKEDIQKAEAALGQIYEVYDFYLSRTNDQTYAMLKVKQMFPSVSNVSKTDTQEGDVDEDNVDPLEPLIIPPKVDQRNKKDQKI